MSAEIYRNFRELPGRGTPSVAKGADSIVYRFDKFAIKIYRSGISWLSPEQALTYMRVTNYLATFAEETNLRQDFLGHNFKVRVNPIIDIIYDQEADCSVNISPWVDGSRLSDLYAQPPRWRPLQALQDEFEFRLGMTGLNIVGSNIKIGDQALVITDTCSAITQLKPKPVCYHSSKWPKGDLSMSVSNVRILRSAGPADVPTAANGTLLLKR